MTTPTNITGKTIFLTCLIIAAIVGRNSDSAGAVSPSILKNPRAADSNVDTSLIRADIQQGREIIAALKNVCSEPVVVAWCYKVPSNSCWTCNLQHKQTSG